MRTVFCLASALVVIVLSGCASAPPQPGDPGTKVFRSVQYDVQMVYPDTLTATRGFDSSYLLSPRWNPDDTQAPGEALLQLTLPHSNKLMNARLRLGVSDDTQAAQHCRLPESGIDTGAVSTVQIGGVTFRRRDTGDAGMSHSVMRHAYRGVAHGNCYAIDLVVGGVSAGAVPGDARPPMSRDAAFKRLTALLAGFRFDG